MSNDLKQRIMSRVQEDVIAIEAALRKNLDAHLPIVSDVAGHILFSGGKRLRPLLMVLSARLCGYDGGREIFFSTIFEYLHTATLLHDDLVDGAGLRRGRAAAHSVWGNEVAVLVGDFLLARSLTIASETGMTDVIKVIAGITENMSQGEIHQLTRKKNLDLTEAEYLEIIRRKTAVLMEGACRVGALISGAAKDRASALGAYGYHLGIAFQMADDLLDYTADTAVLGKAVGADLREGKLTLPVIRALSAAGERDRETMARIITDENFSVDDFNTLVRLLVSLGGIEDTKAEAEFHVTAAKTALSIFADSSDRSTLEDIADYALSRKH
ncbi:MULTISPECIES: polyprenyl synthetase family protein [Desulfococcus]|jgi:octaprenyl-diphosphate synthase|uniref:Polyprenyl synthetase n=1 Tax=Desulfococcus multivorans DSM 2059 TaxID=1121405 RepID=S7TYV2_DESML|nr:polyprenyl synthetase family protein [Desulfococcus multivorans]AOY56892.1 IspB: octaprenyl-diphosphate synthase [Desulfococcus multivorans]AQU99426.1 polyprenyl synthetase [Desulfococcus multivorans]EPR41910.1 Polyprenyl synthetase [Desulfococcus multivorans DSM 2059]MDX9817643.1 polyprenyl synthetase family protein [Desulfococcus multivorans]SJZ94434.1 octaprenyl-diphosphate synthase [Desulfococcus multivorans DSM 2059]